MPNLQSRYQEMASVIELHTKYVSTHIYIYNLIRIKSTLSRFLVTTVWHLTRMQGKGLLLGSIRKGGTEQAVADRRQEVFSGFEVG
jgi:hypothetical protein